MFGRVPFAFNVAHVYLIHALSCVLGVSLGLAASQLLTWFPYFPEGYGVSLPGVYLTWFLVTEHVNHFETPGWMKSESKG
jgi:hypothetical protein